MSTPQERWQDRRRKSRQRIKDAEVLQYIEATRDRLEVERDAARRLGLRFFARPVGQRGVRAAFVAPTYTEAWAHAVRQTRATGQRWEVLAVNPNARTRATRYTWLGCTSG